MLLQSGKQPEKLRKEITSPGGTTEAGLRALQDSRFEEAIIHCIEETAKRSAEIKEQFAGAALETFLDVRTKTEGTVPSVFIFPAAAGRQILIALIARRS